MNQLPLFFEENLSNGNQFSLSEHTSRHIVQVLRMKEGERLLVTNGEGQRLTVEIILAHKKSTEVKVIRKEGLASPSSKICIAISLLKNTNRFEWFVEKATEIGVSEIVPIICKRTEKTTFREDRMKAISVSAMVQSRQAWLPHIPKPMPFDGFITNANYHQKYIAHCEAQEKKELNSFVKDKALSTVILIGPEGDFTPDEIEKALLQNYAPVSLGDTRLRTETAAMAAAVLLKNA